MGFFTTRWVEASDEEEAKKKAISLVSQELEMLEIVRSPPGDVPLLSVESIYEAESFDDKTVTPGSGFSFFPEESH